MEKRFKEKDMDNKMTSSARYCKEKMKRKAKERRDVEVMKERRAFLKMEGYRFKVDECSYILFESEEDYFILYCLEKDFYNNLFFEQEEIILFYRLSMIEKYIEGLSKIKIKVLYDEKKIENSFRVKFPNICRGESYKTKYEVLDKIENLEEEKKIKKTSFL